jgi:hypothetical protein
MSTIASESTSPLSESQAAVQRKRLSHLVSMVFKLMTEWRYQGGKNHEFDDVEDPNLIDALRVCSSYTKLVGFLDFSDPAVKVDGVDGHEYIIEFSIFGPSISIHAARVRVTSLPLVVGEGHVDRIDHTMDVLQEHSRRLKLGQITTDRAFLIGMSLVISFMDDEDDDQDKDARLAPLLAQAMPTDVEAQEPSLVLEDLIDLDFEAFCAREGDDSVSLQQVREATSKIPGCMAETIIEDDRAERY